LPQRACAGSLQGEDERPDDDPRGGLVDAAVAENERHQVAASGIGEDVVVARRVTYRVVQLDDVRVRDCREHLPLRLELRELLGA